MPKFKAGKKINLIYRSIVSLMILVYLAQKIEWAEFEKLFYKVNYYDLIIAFLILGLAFVVAGVRWYFLLQIQNIKLSLRTVTILTFIGVFFNAFLLGSTGGDVAKLMYVFKSYPNKKTNAATSVLMDRVLGLMVVLFFAVVFIAVKFQAFAHIEQTRMAMLGIVTSFIILLSLTIVMLKTPFEKLPQAYQKLWRKIPSHTLFAELLQGFRQHRYAAKNVFYAVGLSAIVQFLVFVSAYMLSKSINLNVDFIDLAIIITIVTCIISLPISIGGHGVREGAFILLFPVFSVVNGHEQVFDQEMIVLFSFLYFMLGMGWSVAGGIIYLLFDPLKAISYTDIPN